MPPHDSEHESPLRMFQTDAIFQVVLGVRAWTVGNHATVSMWWRSTTQMEITGERDLLSLVLNCHCAPLLPMQELLAARYMSVVTTKEQVMSLRDLSLSFPLCDFSALLITILILDRHEDITKDILELDPWENRWHVAVRRAVMHDNYDACLVATLNPRGLMSPPADLVKQ